MKNWVFLFVMITANVYSQEEPFSRVDWQGHRGARANYAENTIPGFLYALDQRMRTLEMDVVITTDEQVVVSHEPFMDHRKCLDPEGNGISEKAAMRYNIYEMSYEEVKKFDCGSKTHPDFPEQSTTESSKPLLREVIKLAETHADEHEQPKPRYSIEIKSRPDWDRKYHPEVPEYVQLVMEVVQEAGVEKRSIIQSFDPRVLRHLDSTEAKVKLALLVDEDENPRVKLEELGFSPDVICIHYKLINDGLMDLAKKHKADVVAWTVNDEETARLLIEKYKVDGIITDYPLLRANLEGGTEKTIFPD